MEHYSKSPEIRWSDIDANMHVRHSVYYDWGAYTRLCFLNDHGFTAQVFAKEQFGPILFREECIFKKEIHFGDAVSIDVKLLRCKSDLSRWSIQHEIKKNENIHCATLTVDGAWLYIPTRKLISPPEIFKERFLQIPKNENFYWEIVST